jgi:heptosyltransferase-2
VIRGGAIGDFILTLPAISALRSQFPACRLEILGYPHIAGLAVAGGLVDAIRSIEARPLAQFFGKGASLDREWREYFSRFALIVSYLYDPDQVFQENVQACSRAQFVAGPHRPNEQEDVHATDVFLKPLERLAVFDADARPRLTLPKPESGGVEESLSCGEDRAEKHFWLAIHPGSGSERKNWPESSWARLLEWLMESTEAQVLLVGGEAEGERFGRLASCLPADRNALAFQLPLPELARRLYGCSGFIGHDSGITHLAAALGLRLLVLWGDSKETVWRPRIQELMVLRGSAGLRTLSVSTVCSAVGTVFPELAGSGGSGSAG